MIAKNLSVLVAGHKLFTLPGLSRKNSDRQWTSDKAPTAVDNVARLDGAFLALNHDLPIGKHTDLDMSGQIGTEKLVRDAFSLNQQIMLPRPFAGAEFSVSVPCMRLWTILCSRRIIRPRCWKI